MSPTNPKHPSSDRDEEIVKFKWPSVAELGEFGRTEFANGIADIRNALIDEAWFDRASSSVTSFSQSLGWELPGDRGHEARTEDAFGHRVSRANEQRDRAERDYPQELDFDR